MLLSTAAMWLRLIATSKRPCLPLPGSTTVPPLIKRSNCIGVLPYLEKLSQKLCKNRIVGAALRGRPSALLAWQIIAHQSKPALLHPARRHHPQCCLADEAAFVGQ